MRKGAAAVGLAFALLVAGLALFSGTVYRRNLAEVTACAPFNGRLDKTEKSTGYAAWESVEYIYAPVGGAIADVAVREGDVVAEGGVLAAMRFDRDDAEQRLAEIDNSEAKLEVDIENLQIQLDKARRALAEGEEAKAYAQGQYGDAAAKLAAARAEAGSGGAGGAEEEAAWEAELALADMEIAKAELALANAQAMLEAGGATQKEADDAAAALEQQRLARAGKVAAHEAQLAAEREQEDDQIEQLEESAASLRHTAEGYDKSIADAQADIAALELSLGAKSLERDALALQRAPYEKALAEFDAYANIVATQGGVVLEVGVKKGQEVGGNALVATLGVGGTFLVEARVSGDNNFIFPGDECALSNTAHSVTGEVVSVTPDEQGKLVKVRVDGVVAQPERRGFGLGRLVEEDEGTAAEGATVGAEGATGGAGSAAGGEDSAAGGEDSDGESADVAVEEEQDRISAGETFDITFERVSDVNYTLVPNGAVRQDSTGYYLCLIKERDGILGAEYYLARLDIFIGDSDDTNTVVEQGVGFFEPVALSSDRAISPGDTVKVANETEFFIE